MENYNDYNPSQLPAAIVHYLDAHDAGDHAMAAEMFSQDAAVIDDGKRYSGTQEIEQWIRHSSGEFEYVSTRIGQLDASGDAPTVLVRVDGNFPGGTVTLRYQFEFAEGLIASLVIGV